MSGRHAEPPERVRTLGNKTVSLPSNPLDANPRSATCSLYGLYTLTNFPVTYFTHLLNRDNDACTAGSFSG